MKVFAGKCLVLTGLLTALPGVALADRTYTLDADFDEGVLSSVNHDAPNGNQLQLDTSSTTEPFIWLANFSLGAVTKVDTRTGRQVAKYDSVLVKNWDGTVNAVASPRANCNSPSRTAVDGAGNAFVANRALGCGVSPAVTKYAGSLSACVDRNGNGKIDTSNDANGNGVIDINDPSEFF
ncbi:MAG TPA: hypothetical protein VLQ93_04975, partial [Myxococcaceae bacterium]|nr:hypothetical protein [Myxococcaceae bacterium]